MELPGLSLEDVEVTHNGSLTIRISPTVNDKIPPKKFRFQQFERVVELPWNSEMTAPKMENGVLSFTFKAK
jgi:HSP20 family molecular chaperone IbpA